VPAYRLYGVTAASDLALPELPPAGGAAALTIRHGGICDAAGTWFDIWPHSDGRSWVRARRTPAGYQVRHGDRAAFEIERAARVIVYDAPDCEPALLRHFLIDQVVPLMLSLDALVLHASSVITGGGTAVFVGPGGAGKSTLALALARAGCAMVSDDGLLLRQETDRVLGTPAYAGVRLWEDSAAALGADAGSSVAGASANKNCYRETPAFASDAPPLAGIHVVDPRPSPGVTFDRLSGADAVIEIVRQTYRLALDDGAALARQLDDIVALTRRVPVWRLSFPRALADLAPLAASIAARLPAPAEDRA
jgi:hypothetical protein